MLGKVLQSCDRGETGQQGWARVPPVGLRNILLALGKAPCANPEAKRFTSFKKKKNVTTSTH